MAHDDEESGRGGEYGLREDATRQLQDTDMQDSNRNDGLGNNSNRNDGLGNNSNRNDGRGNNSYRNDGLGNNSYDAGPGTSSYNPNYIPEITSKNHQPDDVVSVLTRLGGTSSKSKKTQGRKSDTATVKFASPSTIINPPTALAKDALAKLPEYVDILEQWEGEDSWVQTCAFSLAHSWRMFGYLPWLAMALKKYPRRVIMSVIAYYSLRLNTKWWNDSVHKFLRYAASPDPTIIRANKEKYDKTKQYMICIHPHGMLVCGWWTLLCRHGYSDEEGSVAHQRGIGILDDIEGYLCVAPCVKYFPFHGEVYQSKGTDSSADTIRDILQVKKMCAGVAPGGFSEAIYTNYRPNEEVAFILERYGFIKIAIESKVDIIPSYTFGVNHMYSTMDAAQHQRAVWSQRLNLPFMIYWGKSGSAVPYNEHTVTVTFDPFPSSTYTLDQVEEAHRDYCVYLKKCFDEYKFVTESTKNSELVFAGRQQQPARL